MYKSYLKPLSSVPLLMAVLGMLLLLVAGLFFVVPFLNPQLLIWGKSLDLPLLLQSFGLSSLVVSLMPMSKARKAFFLLLSLSLLFWIVLLR